MQPRKQRGYSMLELMIVISILLILAAITAISLQPAMRRQDVTNAYNLTLASLRRAHDNAAANMEIYEVTFTATPGVITVNLVTPNANGAGGVVGPVVYAEPLPPDVNFNVEAATAAATPPDGFGSETNAIDFDWGPHGAGGGNTVFFYPDGTARDVNGNINNGVIYLDMPGQIQTQRAISLWGFTGRIRGWQLYYTSGAWKWIQQ